MSHLPYSVCQNLDDLIMGRCNDALPVDFNDAVPDADSSSLCYTTPHQTANLQPKDRKLHVYSSE